MIFSTIRLTWAGSLLGDEDGLLSFWGTKQFSTNWVFSLWWSSRCGQRYRWYRRHGNWKLVYCAPFALCQVRIRNSIRMIEIFMRCSRLSGWSIVPLENHEACVLLHTPLKDWRRQRINPTNLFHQWTTEKVRRTAGVMRTGYRCKMKMRAWLFAGDSLSFVGSDCQ